MFSGGRIALVQRGRLRWIFQGVIRGKKTFTDRYGINRWNLNALEKGQSTQNSVQLPWLTYLVRDYGISAKWLLTGEGEMFARKPANSK